MLVGLISSVFIGLVAWYNSKRPPGWENAQRPDYIPKVGLDGAEETANPGDSE